MDRNSNLLLAILFALSSPLTLLLTLVMSVPAALFCKKMVSEDNRFAYHELDEALTYAEWSKDFYGPSHENTRKAYVRYCELINELAKAGLIDEDDLDVWT